MSTTGELLEIRGLARDFAAAELRPNTEKWDAERALDDGVVAKIAELGFFGMLVPEVQGGMGFELPTFLAALEEIAWGEPAVALLITQHVLAADLVARYGGDTHAELLGALASGERIACIAFAEDDGDARAVQAGADWKIDGTRSWVTNAARADVAIVAARTDDGVGAFVVPRGDGYAVAGTAATMGLRAVPVNTIRFDGSVMPQSGRLSWSGRDPHDALEPLGVLSAAAIAAAIARAALEHAVAYAAQREQFGQPLRSFEGIQFKLAEMATRVTAASALIERAAARPDDSAAAMAKLAAATCAMYVTTEAVQIFGGYGYMRDYPVEKLMRDAKAMEILHGTNEMQRLKIAAALYAE